MNSSLRTVAGLHVASGGTLTDTGKRTLLANTQEHWSMEGRDIVREANFEGDDGYKSNPAFVTGIGMESHSPAVYGDLKPEEFARLSPEQINAFVAEYDREINEVWEKQVHGYREKTNTPYENLQVEGYFKTQFVYRLLSEDLIEALGLEDFVLIGHSFGAMIAAEIAAA